MGLVDGDPSKRTLSATVHSSSLSPRSPISPNPAVIMAAAEVLAALTTLYTAATPTARREADAFLDAFQKSREAWDAAFAMLESPATPAEGRTFAAQTIKLKCIYDLDTYPDVQTLRARVLHLFSALHAERTVYTHLAVALSSLVIQTEWADPFSDVMSGLAPAGDSEAARRALAEFLRVLPEEGRRDRYRGANARWKERAPKVLEWAAAGLNGGRSERNQTYSTYP